MTTEEAGGLLANGTADGPGLGTTCMRIAHASRIPRRFMRTCRADSVWRRRPLLFALPQSCPRRAQMAEQCGTSDISWRRKGWQGDVNYAKTWELLSRNDIEFVESVFCFSKIFKTLSFLPRHLLVPRSIGVVWSYPSHLPASPETLAGVLDYMNSHFWLTQVDSVFFFRSGITCFFHTNCFTRVQAGLVCNAEIKAAAPCTGREVLCL